jgi:hypothetical protein
MATAELIEPESIPAARSGLGARAQTVLAMRHLQAAQRAGKAVRLVLSEQERANTLRGRYFRAAKALALKVQITGSDQRAYHAVTGAEKQEWGTLYVRVLTPAPAPAPAPAPPAVEHEARRPVGRPPTRVSPPVSLPPAHRPARLASSIPTPTPGYSALGHGIEVDR